MTDSQRRLQKLLDKVGLTLQAYLADKVPDSNTITLEGLAEELGQVNEVRKAVEKVENILKTRIKAAGLAEVVSDNYIVEITTAQRTALNQEKVKAMLAEEGILEDYMTTTTTETLRVKSRL